MLKKNSGNALIVTVIAMFFVATATAAILMVTANALHLNGKQTLRSAAFNVAESGAGVADLWLMKQPSPPTGTAPLPDITGTIAGGTYVATITPCATNATYFLKTYKIRSVGTANGETKTVEIVVRQSSFGRYAYFTDKETSVISGGAIWWKAGETIDGPAHSNNANGTNFQINYNGSTSPIFLDMVTAAGTSMTYNPGTPNNETTFKKVFLNGSKGYQLGVSPIPLPQSSDTQKNAAWGSSSGFPSNNGVYLKNDSSGGLYIRGDAAVQLSVNSSGNQKITVTQGSNVTTITYNKSTNAVTTSGPMGSGSAKSASTLGTGVVYCTGNITSLKGQVADNKVVNGAVETASAWTIATDVNAGKSIKITDDVTYKTKPDKTKGSTDPVNLAAGTLGLVAEDIIVASTAPADLEIDAVCLAGGQNTTDSSFRVENYDSKTPVGTLNVLGGIIQKARGPVGTFNASTGVTSTGYSKNYKYDPRLATNPPPYFPTTGQYERLSWQIQPH